MTATLSAKGNAKSHRIKNSLEHHHDRIQKRIMRNLESNQLCMIGRKKPLEVSTAQTLVSLGLARVTMEAPTFMAIERIGVIRSPRVKGKTISI